MIRRPPRSTQSRSSAASDVYKRQSCTSARRPAAAIRQSRKYTVSTSETRTRKITSARSALLVTSWPHCGPTKEESTSATSTPYAVAKACLRELVWTSVSEDVCTRIVPVPTTETRGGSAPSMLATASRAGCWSVVATLGHCLLYTSDAADDLLRVD